MIDSVSSQHIQVCMYWVHYKWCVQALLQDPCLQETYNIGWKQILTYK